jgi:hypothetical protein
MEILNKIYENNELFYWCNGLGEINIPGTDPLSYHEVDELPELAKELYENYWTDRYIGKMYVVDYKGKPAMAINYVFDEFYVAELLNKDKATFGDMVVVYNALVEYAKKLEWKSLIWNCEVLVGFDTDPDGHELLVVVPYEQRSKIKSIAQYLDDYVYNAVESLL